MIEDISSNTKVLVTFSSKCQKSDWKQRTRPKNKLRMNMKVLLNYKFKKNTVTLIDDSSSEGDPQINDLEYTVNETMEDIEKCIESFPKVFEE